MYRCEVCRITQPPRSPKRKHLVTRGDGTIAREIAVCEGCEKELVAGTPLSLVAQQSQVGKVLNAIRSKQ